MAYFCLATLSPIRLVPSRRVYLPLTITSLGRRAWTSLKVTSKRLIFELDSPVAKRREEILWSDTASVETVPRCFNLWGDLVIKTKKGNLLQIVGIEKHEEIRNYIRGRIG